MGSREDRGTKEKTRKDLRESDRERERRENEALLLRNQRLTVLGTALVGLTKTETRNIQLGHREVGADTACPKCIVLLEVTVWSCNSHRW